MDGGQGVIRRIAWHGLFPSLLLVRSLGLSLRLPILLCALAGMLLCGWGGRAIARFVFTDTTDPFVQAWSREAQSAPRSFPWLGAATETPRPDYLGQVSTALASAWWSLTAPLVRLFQPRLSAVALGYLVLQNAWNVFVWALLGGAITRMAAVDLTRQERLGLTRCSYDAGRQFPNHVLAPGIAILAVLIMTLPLLGVGLLARLPSAAWIAGALWGGLLLIGLFVALLAAGVIVGWPLLWATIAVEQSDAFDAVSRSYAYVYQRPLHLAAYILFAAFLAALGTIAMDALADGTILATDWAVSWGSGAEVIATLQEVRGVEADLDTSTLWSGAAAGRRWWVSLAEQVKAAYPIGFLWTVSVGIYLLLRLHVDGTQTDEIAANASS